MHAVAIIVPPHSPDLSVLILHDQIEIWVNEGGAGDEEDVSSVDFCDARYAKRLH